jgi:hypothetical protein
MKVNTVKCEAVKVNTASGICVGLAKTKQGETCLIDGRTPEGNGMCANAFGALSNGVFLMMAMDQMPAEQNGMLDRVCPHGCVTFRLSRSEAPKKKPFHSK